MLLVCQFPLISLLHLLSIRFHAENPAVYHHENKTNVIKAFRLVQYLMVF